MGYRFPVVNQLFLLLWIGYPNMHISLQSHILTLLLEWLEFSLIMFSSCMECLVQLYVILPLQVCFGKNYFDLMEQPSTLVPVITLRLMDKAVNRTLEMYLRCFTSSRPKEWTKWLTWAEYCYNTSWYSMIKRSPFEVVYRRAPPIVLSYFPGIAKVAVVEEELKDR